MKRFIPPIILFLVTVVFFYKSFLFFHVPFPGDLLISEYAPWKYESYLGYNPGSYPNKAQYFDVIRQLYPWKIFVIEELKKGDIPLWNPYNFSGSPLLANNQSSVFNPFNALFFIFNYSIAWSAFIIVQPLLASLFMFVYLRQLKLTQQASLLGGLSYGFSLFMSTFLEYGNFGHTIMWLPLLLYLIELSSERIRAIFQYFIPIIIALIFFSGHLQLAFGILGFVFFYIIFKSKNKIRMLVLIFLGIGFSSIQLIPTFELIFYSARVPHDLGVLTRNFLLQINQLILFVSPDTYGNPATRNYLLTDTYPGNAVYLGIVPFVFMFYSVIKCRQNPSFKFYGWMSILLFLFLTNNPISYFFYSLRIPLMATSAPSNFIFLLTFSLSVLGAIGFASWQSKKDNTLMLVICSTITISLLLLGMHQMLDIAYLTKQSLLGIGVLIIFGIGILLSNHIGKKVITYFLLALTFLELFYYFQKFNPFVPASLMYPSTQIEKFLSQKSEYGRFWGLGSANIEANFSTIFKTYSPEGYDPLYPQWYAKMFYMNDRIFSSRSDAKFDQSDPQESIDKNKGQYTLLNQFGVKFILDRVENGTSEKTFPSFQFDKVHDLKGWRVMKNKKAWPRAFVVKSQCLEKSENNNCLEEQNMGKVTILKYTPTEVILKTGSESGHLMISDTYYPGWKAYIENKEVKIIKTHNGMRRIEDVKANSKVNFIYEPNSFKWGAITTIISMILVAVFLKRTHYEK